MDTPDTYAPFTVWRAGWLLPDISPVAVDIDTLLALDDVVDTDAHVDAVTFTAASLGLVVHEVHLDYLENMTTHVRAGFTFALTADVRVYGSEPRVSDDRRRHVDPGSAPAAVRDLLAVIKDTYAPLLPFGNGWVPYTEMLPEESFRCAMVDTIRDVYGPVLARVDAALLDVRAASELRHGRRMPRQSVGYGVEHTGDGAILHGYSHFRADLVDERYVSVSVGLYRPVEDAGQDISAHLRPRDGRFMSPYLDLPIPSEDYSLADDDWGIIVSGPVTGDVLLVGPLDEIITEMLAEVEHATSAAHTDEP